MRLAAVLVMLLGVLAGPGLSQESTPDVFARGQAALSQGDLTAAETAFRQVLVREPHSVPALANLGVVHMRRKNWDVALGEFRQAERLLPKNPGLELNIGLALYRTGQFEQAIAPFRFVVEQDASSVQANYLEGLCLFATEKYSEAADTLAPLWEKQKDHMPYLYMLAMAASKAKREPLEQQALDRLYQVGNGSAEYHLFLGRAWLVRQHSNEAEKELKEAAQLDPKLPYVHYSLGTIYAAGSNYRLAKTEFLADAAIEPDLSVNYEELGEVCASLEEESEAKANFLNALRLNPRSVPALLGLAKIERSEGALTNALLRIEAAAKLAPDNAGVHYLRGQLLSKVGRKQEAAAEFAVSTKLRQANGNRLEEEVTGRSRSVDAQLGMAQ